MTWCYVPEMDFPCAQAAADSIWASASQNPSFTQDVLSNGKRIHAKQSSPPSAPDTLPRPQFGTTLEPLTLNPSPVPLIRYSPDTRAKVKALLEIEPDKTMSAGYGKTLPELSKSLAPASDGVFSKTSGDMLRLASKPCCEAFKAWALRIALAYSQRQKQARRMNGKEYSSWPTAKAISGGANSNRKARGAGGPDLQEAAQNWTTPSSSDGARGGTGVTENMSGSSLTQKVAQWPTPMAGTPAQNGNSAAGNNDFSRKAEALAKTINWPTPVKRIHKGSGAVITRKDGKSRLDQLDYLAEQGFFHRDQVMPTHGRKSLLKARTLRPLWALMTASGSPGTLLRLWKTHAKRRLNPLFVEWLMGWPSGHALCDCSAMEFTHWQQRMRGAVSALPMAYGPWIWEAPQDPQAEETQLDLF